MSINIVLTMKQLSQLIVLLLFLAIITACGGRDDTYYRVECNVASELGVDSVSLMLVKEDYGSVYNAGKVGVDNTLKVFVFEGQIEEPCVAYLKFDNDTTQMLFVLEPGLTQMTIGAKGMTISGGDANREYMAYLKSRNALLAEKRKLQEDYLRNVAPDSTISVDVEKQFLTRDSLLTDSMERITVDAINRGSLASRIILDRYINTLSHHNLQNIHKK